MHRRHALAALLCASVVPAIAASPATARSYRAYDLGELQPVAVNATNQVAGLVPALKPGGAGGSYAAVWSDGSLRALPPLIGSRADANASSAYDIADDGTVVGVSPDTTVSSWRPSPVVWLPGAGAPVDLGDGDGGYMQAIAPSGGIAAGWHYTNVGMQPPVPIRATIAGGKVTAGTVGGTQQLQDVNDAGDLIGFDSSATSDPYTLLRGGQTLPLRYVTARHPLGEDGSVVMLDLPGTGEVLIRRPDGTILRTGLFQSAIPADAVHGINPRAIQNGALVGEKGASAFFWKAGTLLDLSPYLPARNGAAPDFSTAVDLSTKGAIVGVSTWNVDVVTSVQRGWLLILQVKITGQVVEPSLPPASPARLATRAATRPVKGARVVLTPAGGTPITVTTDAQGRFSADVPPGKVAITLPGRSGCVTAACATTTTIDAQDDLALAVRLDPTTKPAAPTLPKGAIRVKRGAVPLTLRCRLVSTPCRITATVRTKRKVLATAVVTVKAGRTAVRTLPLTKAGKAALAGGTAVKATLTLVTRTPTGRRLTATFGVRVRR